MVVDIGGYTFQGFFQHIPTLDEKPGLYAIICDNDGIINLLDVGESHNIRESVWNHDRKNRLKKKCYGMIVYAQLLTFNKDKKGRREIEKDIRDKENLPCARPIH